jgi:hypothetical protein
MDLKDHILQRATLLGLNEESFSKQQRMINICDSLKDAFGVKADCLVTFKNVLKVFYNIDPPASYKTILHPMEKKVDENKALGPLPQAISFLYLKSRKNLMIQEARLPLYVEYAVQDSGYKPISIQPNIKTLLLNFSEFDPATRDTTDVVHHAKDTVLEADILSLLGLPNTSITCKSIKPNVTYELSINTRYKKPILINDSITIGNKFNSQLNKETCYFLGNKEKNDATNDLCKGGNEEEIFKYAIAKLWGDKGQVIGTLLYMLENELGDKICMFTTDKVVAMLCRMLGVSCCLQDHDEDDEKEQTALSKCRVKYYGCKQDPKVLFEAQIKNEIDRCINHNTQIKNELLGALAEGKLIVGSQEITIPVEQTGIREFLQKIDEAIDNVNRKIQEEYSKVQTLVGDYDTRFNDFKLFVSNHKATLIVSAGKGEMKKALQTAARLFPKAAGVDDPILRSGVTFGAALISLRPQDNDVKGFYKKRIRLARGGGTEDIDNQDISLVTDMFLNGAEEVIYRLEDKFMRYMPILHDIYRVGEEEGSTAASTVGEGSGAGEGSGEGSGYHTPDKPPFQPSVSLSGPRTLDFSGEVALPRGQSTGSQPIGSPASSLQFVQTTSIASFNSPPGMSAAMSMESSQERQAQKRGAEAAGIAERSDDPKVSRTTEGLEGLHEEPPQQGGNKSLLQDIENYLTNLKDSYNEADPLDKVATSVLDFLGDNDKYDILYLLHTFLDYIGETPFDPDLIEFLVLRVIQNPFYELDELKAEYEAFQRPQEGGAPKRKTRKIKRKLKGILKTRNKKRNTLSKRKTRK